MPHLDFQQKVLQGLLKIQLALQHSATQNNDDHQAVYFAGIRYEMGEIMRFIGASHLENLPLRIPQAIRELAAALEGGGVVTLGTLAAIAGPPTELTPIESQTEWWHELERGPMAFPENNYLESVERCQHIKTLLFLNQVQYCMLRDVCTMLQDDASIVLGSAAAQVQASLAASVKDYHSALDKHRPLP